MAPPVHLDVLARPRPRWPWLALAATLLLIALLRHNDLQAQAEAARLRELARQGAQPAAAQAALPDLDWPWATLLDALEQSAQDDVALLTLEADAKANQLRIGAETPDPAQMQAYLESLARRGLAAPRLTRQESVQPDEDDTVPVLTRFNVEATWHR